MHLYVNGDSHTAAAEARNPAAFAEDDSRYHDMGRVPHPENLAVSWCTVLSQKLQAQITVQAESASSNQRILRTTRQWLSQHRPDLVVIQWSTWERQEWIIDSQTFQVTASGTDDVPRSHREQYQQWIAELDWAKCQRDSHDAVWQLHTELQHAEIPHVFFNGNCDFQGIEPRDWQGCYIDPYQKIGTFDAILRNHGFKTVNSQSWHFGEDAHCFWADFLLQYIFRNQLLGAQ